MTSIDELQRQSYNTSADKGFHQNDTIWGALRSAGMDINDETVQKCAAALRDEWFRMKLAEKMLLLIGEVSEAHEELRTGHDATEIYKGDNGKPEGFPIEMADVGIRWADLNEMASVNLTQAVTKKAKYNAKRPHMHGRIC